MKKNGEVKIYLVRDVVQSLHSRMCRVAFIAVENPTLSSTFGRKSIEVVMRIFLRLMNKKKGWKRGHLESSSCSLIFFSPAFSSLSLSPVRSDMHRSPSSNTSVKSVRFSRREPTFESSNTRSVTRRDSSTFSFDGIRDALSRILPVTSIQAANGIG